jgi:putative ABC transport system permease protein
MTDHGILLDLRHAGRTLRRRPGAAITAIVTMAAGIAAVGTVFSFINAALFRPLPYRDAARMVALSVEGPGVAFSFSAVSGDELTILRAGARSFDRLAAFAEGSATMIAGPGAEPTIVAGSAVDAAVFELMAPHPLLGRGIIDADVRERAPVVVLGERTWRVNFGGDDDVLGRLVHLNDTLRTVIGVMPESFRFYERSDLWIPLHIQEGPGAGGRGPTYSVIGRLAPGVSRAQARAELAELSARLPSLATAGVPRFVMRDAMVNRGPGVVRPFALLFICAALLVLAVACANIASLFLARAAARRPEMILRASLGASRWRLMRLCLAETLVLAAAAGVLGMLASVWGVEILKAWLPLWAMPIWVQIGLDARVLAVTWLATFVAAAAVGVAPALAGTRVDLADALKGSSHTTTHGLREGRRTRVLLVGEVAVALTLFLGAAMVLRTYESLGRLDRGFDVGRVLALSVSLSATRYPDESTRRAFYEEVGERLRLAPDVRTVALQGTFSGIGTNRHEMSPPRRPDRRLFLPERPDQPVARDVDPGPDVHVVSDAYFRTMGMRVVRGRGFGAQDAGDDLVVVVSQRLAELAWGGDAATAVGRRLRIGEDGPTVTVIGVASDIRRTRFGGAGLSAPVLPDLYLSDRQASGGQWRLLVATAGDAHAAIPLVRSAARAVDPDQPVAATRVLPDREGAGLALRAMAAVLTVFAGCAFVLSLIGLVGVVSHTVVQRRREFGIHLALGATPRQVVRIAMDRTTRLTLLGCAIGLALALIAARGFVGGLRGVAAPDGFTLAVATLVFAAIAVTAAYVPARRAAHVDVVRALRDA